MPSEYTSHNTLPGHLSPEDVTLAASRAQERIRIRRAARRQHVGVLFEADAQIIRNECGVFVEGKLFYKVESF